MSAFQDTDFSSLTETTADTGDNATRLELLATREALNNARHAAQTKRMPQEPGFCDVCGEETASPAHLFCSLACSQRDAQREKILGITNAH